MSAIDPEDGFATDSVKHARERIASGARGDDVLRSNPPGALDLFDPRTLVAIVVAFVSVAMVDLDAARHPAPFDALDLALRMIAFTCVIRASILVSDGVRRVRAMRHDRANAVVLLDEAMVSLGTNEVVVRREDIVAAAGARRPDGQPTIVVLAKRMVGSPTIALPIASDLAPEAIARRVNRYRAEAEAEAEAAAEAEPQAVTFPEPSRAPAAEFARAVCAPGPGETVVGVGYEWLRRGPFAAAAFSVVFVERLVSVSRDLGTIPLDSLTAGLLAACLLVPLSWLAFGFARIRAMGGAAMVATRAELLMRNRAGMHRVPWSNVESVGVTSRRTFTMLGGSTVERSLVVHRADGATLRFDESVLAEPVENVRVILEAYCEGVATPPSQGTGAGGGISGTSGTIR